MYLAENGFLVSVVVEVDANKELINSVNGSAHTFYIKYAPP